MSMSGIKISDEVLEALSTYSSSGSKKNDPNILVMGMNADSTQVALLDQIVPADVKDGDCWRHVANTVLKDDECLYIAMMTNVNTLKEGGGKTGGPICLYWAPDSASIKKKMLSASTLNTLKDKMGSAFAFTKASDRDELGADLVIDSFKALKGKEVCCIDGVPVVGKPGKYKFAQPFGSVEPCKTHSKN